MVAATRGSKREHDDLSTLADVVCLSSSTKVEKTAVRSGKKRSNVSPVQPICIGSSTGGETSLLGGTRKKKKRTRVNSGVESDDDYVSDTPLQQTDVSAHVPHRWGSLKSRSSPRQLFLGISKLSARQREAVCQMGFAELLGFSVDGIPVKLAHYVVDAFQPDRMRLKCRQHEVNIDATVVQKLFGIPCGGTKFSTLDEPTEWHPKLRAWRKRYPPNIYVSTSLITEKIHEDAYDDMFLFKVDFIMLFVTTMISSHGNGLCREEIPKCFTTETSFENIDWCDFLITSLRTCKQKWRRSDPTCAFAGPLTFLTLLYVDSVEVGGGMNTPIGVRAMHHWSQELLTRRQDYEINHGGFGLGRLKNVTDTTVEADELEGELHAARAAMSDLKAAKLRVASILSSLCSRHPTNTSVVSLKVEYEKELGVRWESGCGPSTHFDTPSKVIERVVTDVSKQYTDPAPNDEAFTFEGAHDESPDSIERSVLPGAEDDKHIVESGDSSDSSADGHWLFTRHTPMPVDSPPAPVNMGSVPVVEDETARAGVSGKGVASPEALKKCGGVGSEDPLVGDVGGSPGVAKSLAAELDAHRKRFGLSTIWIGSPLPGTSRHVHAGLSQPTFSLGMTQDMPPVTEPTVTGRQNIRSSQPSFSLGLTQEIATEEGVKDAIRVEDATECRGVSSQPTFSLGLTQESVDLSKVGGETAVKGVVLQERKDGPLSLEKTNKDNKGKAKIDPECIVALKTKQVNHASDNLKTNRLTVLQGGVSSQPTFSLGLTQESVDLSKMGGETTVKGVVLQEQKDGPVSSGKTNKDNKGKAKKDAECIVALETVQAPVVRRGATKNMVARLPVVLNDRVELATTSTRTELLVWDFLFRTSEKTELMEQAIQEAKKQNAAIGGVVDEADIDPTEHYPYVMFEDRYGFRAEAPFLQSLALGRRLYGCVIDAWVDVLNHDPLYRFAGGVQRLFLATTTIVDWMLLADGDRNAQRVAAFRSGVSGAVRGNQSLMDLKSFDMVFVPVLEKEHYYVVVFDFKHDDICMLDNIAPKKSPVVLSESSLYVLKSTPYKVKHMFVEYLTLVNHPKANVMGECAVRPVVLPWKTYKNTSDCGVFAMRHMENYCGVSARFNCGFSLNGKRKQTQVDTLRKRFAASILLSGPNIYKDRVWRDAVSM